MQLAHYLGLLHRSEGELARAFDEIGGAHSDEIDIAETGRKLGQACERHAASLEPFVARYGEAEENEPERLHTTLFTGSRTGPLALLRDLHDLYLMATECDVSCVVVRQAAQGLRDHDLLDV